MTSMPSSIFILLLALSVSSGLYRYKRQQETTDTTSPRESSTAKRPNTKTPFTCPFEDGLFADPDTCRRFYTCNHNEAVGQSCPPGLYFDDIKKFCNFKKEAVCGPTDYTTSTALPLDEELLAKKCDPALCTLPDCWCSSDGSRIPGNLNPEDVPQMVVLTFSGGVNLLNFGYYEKLLNKSRTNPNGCRIAATFFTSHEYTNYQNVEKLYAQGNEIALNSISLGKPEEYWTKGSYENWTMEMIGMREILRRFAGIPKEDILGVRGPFTKCGGNEQFDMMNDFGLVYDSTMAAPSSRVPYWPFSLQYKMPFKCRAVNCPSYSYPGIWEMPINIMYAEDGEGGNCAFLDQCVFLYTDTESIYNWLVENFNRHYRSNRAPLGLHMQTNWFLEKERVDALHQFIDTLLEKDDVYFVTTTQALQWVIQPTPLSNIANFEPWKCENKRPSACNLPKTCALPHSGPGIISDLRYMQTCTNCPDKYPWVGNANGEDKLDPDVYQAEVSNGEGTAPAAPEVPAVHESRTPARGNAEPTRASTTAKPTPAATEATPEEEITSDAA